MSHALVEIFKHNLWANLRVLDICEKLSGEVLEAHVPGTYGNIKDTLKHLFGAEERYLYRATGEIMEPQLRDIEGFPGFDVLREHARGSGEGFVRLVSDNLPTEVVVYTVEDGTFAATPVLFIVQAINHATEHRTQILTVLGQHGIELQDGEAVDGWSYGECIFPRLWRRVEPTEAGSS